MKIAANPDGVVRHTLRYDLAHWKGPSFDTTIRVCDGVAATASLARDALLLSSRCKKRLSNAALRDRGEARL